MLNRIKVSVAAFLVAVFAPILAFAQAVGVDTTAVVAELTSVQTAIAVVGGGLLVLAAIALGYRWVKASMF